jgi:hypothetical protein
MIEDEIQCTGAYDIVVSNDPTPHIKLSTHLHEVRAFMDLDGLAQLRDSVLEICEEAGVE